MSITYQIGIDRRIKVQWLEYTAGLAISEYNQKEIRAYLDQFLQEQLSGEGKTHRGCRQKTITVLLKTWAIVPQECESLRNEGLSLLSKTPENEHLIIHWGMIMTVYPFFRSIAETVGRLFRLQNTVSLQQIQRRIKEQYGERPTVSYAAQKIIRSFVDWGVLLDTDKKGVYQKPKPIQINNPQTAAWITEALLISKNRQSSALKDLIKSPALYPFELPIPNTKDLENNKRLELSRQNLADDMVTLRKPIHKAP
ncbi:MAG: hypothetical protein RDU59_11785 [Thermodesulfobacteriota bacterium]|nr:hypothetical protein [Thermodesulfobacteriota bacterium]